MLLRVKKFIRRKIEGLPWLVLPLLRVALGRDSHQVISRNTDVLFEGAGGAANTFVYIAFKFAQRNDSHVKLAGHTHYSAQVIQAVRWGVPVFIAIRDPVDSIYSLLSRSDFESMDECKLIARLHLLDYITFYQAILPYKDHCVISDFQNTITNFNGCIEKINEKFGREFCLFDDSEQGMRMCFGSWKEVVNDPARAIRKNTHAYVIDSDELRPLFLEALSCYDKLKSAAI